MEDLILLKEYAKEHGFSMYTMKQWINDGLKHIGSRPYRTKKAWIDEYIENASLKTTTQQPTHKTKIVRRSKTAGTNYIDISEFM